MPSEAFAVVKSTRVEWPDKMKGIAMLWIAFFHFYNTYSNSQYPSIGESDYFGRSMARCPHESLLGSLGCLIKACLVGLTAMGFHAVGVFIILSGVVLTFTLAAHRDPPGGWSNWYRSRLLRLYPMYIVAHLIFLVSPFVFRPEPIDYRFLLSMLGDRFWPIYTIFYYANPAWWYFTLILQLYLVFPILFRGLQRLGPIVFLTLCGIETFVVRYVLLDFINANGAWLQGAFFGCRLWEFALGMVIGMTLRQNQSRVERVLFQWQTLVGGLAIYLLGLYSYRSPITYTFSDALTGTGLFLILTHVVHMNQLSLAGVGRVLAHVGAYSYGLYLLHQPYVLWIGVRVRWLSGPEFCLLAAVVITVLAIVSMQIERAVNRATNWLLDRRPPPQLNTRPSGSAAAG
jgi:peptidoglycan/LPS O-acetylase OafA/YrhL